MSFPDEGFLSSSIAAYAAEYRAQHPGWFALTFRLNKLGMRLYLEASTSYAEASTSFGDGQRLLIVALFARSLSLFEGAVLMTERGMTAEAGALARACLETAFFIGAATNDATFLSDMIIDDRAHKKKIALFLTRLNEASQGCTPAELEQVQEFLKEIDEEKLSTLTMKKAAEKAGLIDIYHSVYAHLSSIAAHPKAGSLEQYAKFDSNGRLIALQFGPHGEGVADALNHACISFLHAATSSAHVLGNSDVATELKECLAEYGVLAAPGWAKN